MAQPLTGSGRGAPQARPARRRFGLSWLGLMPFLIFAFFFLVLPASYLVYGSFLKDDQLSLQNYADLTTGRIPNAFATSIEVSLVTAILGGFFGFLLAYAVIIGGLPRWLRNFVMTFSGVASNFAGVPLALAFIFTLGRTGFLTSVLELLGLDIYEGGFALTGKLGLEIVYLYFQLPLMVLIIAPALDGLKKEWREAAENLGATPAQFWRQVALPVLTPSILGAMVLLFGNAFGAQATAYQLTGGTLNLVTLVVSSQIRGDVLHNPGLGYAVAMGMVVIMAVSITGYSILQRRAERWLRA